MARPRSFDEPRVLRQAREVFHDHGYTATSIEQLSQVTGLNRSSLYGAFGDKHQLFIDCFTQYCDEDSRLIKDELSGDEAGALKRLHRHFRAKASDPVASRRGCLLAKSTAELASEDPDVARLAKTFYAQYERAIVDCVAQAQAAGGLRADISAADAGAMLLAALRGIEALGRAGQSRRALRRIADTTLEVLAVTTTPELPESTSERRER